MPYSDERTIFFDLALIGATPGGVQRTYDSFVSETASTSVLRGKGQRLAVEPRLGFRTPIFFSPGSYWHAGTYYEASRWEKTAGRVHATSGLSHRFTKWFELIVGADFARDYQQILLSFR